MVIFMWGMRQWNLEDDPSYPPILCTSLWITASKHSTVRTIATFPLPALKVGEHTACLFGTSICWMLLARGVPSFRYRNALGCGDISEIMAADLIAMGCRV